jgi:hypothetical protein
MDKVPFNLLVLAFILVGCNKPNADICALYVVGPPSEWVLQCSNMNTGDYYEMPIEQGDKYLAASPDDYERIRAWYKSECDGR